MSKQPNILVIMVDELAPQFMPDYGHDVVQTPNISRLAARGTVFDNAYTSSPLCAPARASFMTGKLALRSTPMTMALNCLHQFLQLRIFSDPLATRRHSSARCTLSDRINCMVLKSV